MSPEEVLTLFHKTGALLEGHFLYASGRHGSQFLQAARVVQYPGHTATLCRALAEPYADRGVDVVVGPATGGIVLAYETARHLGARAAFTEKEPDGSMALKRGFRLKEGERALVVEDIVTTGGSVRKTIGHLTARGAAVVAAAFLIDRSAGLASFDCPFTALAAIDMESYPPEECPMCAQGLPVTEPDDIVL